MTNKDSGHPEYAMIGCAMVMLLALGFIFLAILVVGMALKIIA